MLNELIQELATAFVANPIRFCDRALIVAYCITTVISIIGCIVITYREHRRLSCFILCHLVVANLTVFLGLFGAFMLVYRENVSWQLMILFQASMIGIGSIELVATTRLIHLENSLVDKVP